MNRRQKTLFSTVFSVCLALICYSLLLAISNDHQKSFDLTAEKRFSFSRQTEDVVAALKEPVKLYAFADPSGDTRSIENLLDRYRRLSKNFSFEMVDLEKKPTLAESMEVRAYGQGVLEKVESSPAEGRVPRRERLMTFDEASITNALLKLTAQESKKVGFLVGHGERAIVGSEKNSLSSMVTSLTSEGFVSETIKLAESQALPPDLSLLVMAGPTAPLLPKEQELVDSYIKDGGKLLFLADISTPDSYVTWLQGYGFELKDSVIIDPAAEMAKAEPVFALGQDYSREHAITKSFVDYTAFRLSRPVAVAEAAPPLGDGASPKLDVLVNTQKTAFVVPIETIRQNAASITADPNEAASYPMAAAGLYPRKTISDLPEGESPPQSEPVEVSARIVVVGNTEAFTNSLFTFVSNRDFVLNTVNWLAESENQITVRAKDPKSQPLVLEKQKEKWMTFLFCLLIPFLSMLTGVLVHFGRRRGLA